MASRMAKNRLYFCFRGIVFDERDASGFASDTVPRESVHADHFKFDVSG